MDAGSNAVKHLKAWQGGNESKKAAEGMAQFPTSPCETRDETATKGEEMWKSGNPQCWYDLVGAITAVKTLSTDRRLMEESQRGHYLAV
jgi:hypothetical protein